MARQRLAATTMSHPIRIERMEMSAFEDGTEEVAMADVTEMRLVVVDVCAGGDHLPFPLSAPKGDRLRWICESKHFEIQNVRKATATDNLPAGQLLTNPDAPENPFPDRGPFPWRGGPGKPVDVGPATPKSGGQTYKY